MNQQLTEYDIDCITVMMVEAVHIAERCIQMTELYQATGTAHVSQAVIDRLAERVTDEER